MEGGQQPQNSTTTPESILPLKRTRPESDALDNQDIEQQPKKKV